MQSRGDPQLGPSGLGSEQGPGHPLLQELPPAIRSPLDDSLPHSILKETLARKGSTDPPGIDGEGPWGQQASARGHGTQVPKRGHWVALTPPWWEKWSLAASERLCAPCLPPPAQRTQGAPIPG